MYVYIYTHICELLALWKSNMKNRKLDVLMKRQGPLVHKRSGSWAPHGRCQGSRFHVIRSMTLRCFKKEQDIWRTLKKHSYLFRLISRRALVFFRLALECTVSELNCADMWRTMLTCESRIERTWFNRTASLPTFQTTDFIHVIVHGVAACCTQPM